eukprot:s14351_g1.t1
MTYHDYDVAWVVAVTRKLCQMRLTLKQVVGAWPREDGPPSLRSPVLLASICFKSVFLRSACRPPGRWTALSAVACVACFNLLQECVPQERMQAPVVHTTTKTVVSAPRSFVPGPPTVKTATKTVVSAPRPAPAGLVGPNFEVPLQKGVEKLLPGEVCELLHKGQCCLIDVRGDDRASGYIQGAVHEPTSFQAPLLNRVLELVEKFGNEKLVAGSSASCSPHVEARL